MLVSAVSSRPPDPALSGFTSSNALTTLLTVKSLLFSGLAVALTLVAASNLALRARREARLLAAGAATLHSLIAVGAASAWVSLFLGYWPDRLADQIPIACLAAGIVAQPLIGWIVCWLLLRRPPVDPTDV